MGLDSGSGPAVAGLINCFFIKKFWKVEREESLRLTDEGERPVDSRYCLYSSKRDWLNKLLRFKFGLAN